MSKSPVSRLKSLMSKFPVSGLEDMMFISQVCRFVFFVPKSPVSMLGG